MTVLDNSFFEEDDDAVNTDLSPIELSPIEEEPEIDDETGLIATKIAPGQLDEPIEQPELGNEIDIIATLLKEKGIDNPLQIKFEEEDGTITDKSFYDLTQEEQLEILASNELESDYGLEDNEVEAINLLRENNMTLGELIDFHKKQAIEEYVNSNISNSFEIDSYSDEELYVLDLKAKYEDLTNEELTLELEKALEIPDLFKKKIDKIRTEYKELENQERQALTDDQNQQRDQLYSDIKTSLIDVANKTEDIGGLILEDSDKEDVLNMVVDRDLNGLNSLVKALDDPDMLFKTAWFVSKGEEAFKILHDYYKKQIEEVRKNSYQKGKEDSVKGLSSKPINIISKPSQQINKKNQSQRYSSIDELHSFD